MAICSMQQQVVVDPQEAVADPLRIGFNLTAATYTPITLT
jgi:hypothetical protein